MNDIPTNKANPSEPQQSDKPRLNANESIEPSEKIKVLLGCLSFANLTGSEIYVYELAKALSKQNCDITICLQIGDLPGEMARQ